MPESGKHRKITEKVTKVPFQKVLRVYHLFKWDQRLTVCTQILTISVIIKITLLLLAIHLMQVINIKKVIMVKMVNFNLHFVVKQISNVSENFIYFKICKRVLIVFILNSFTIPNEERWKRTKSWNKRAGKK